MAIETFHWAQAQPKIVQYQGRRFALRLENAFWRQLESIAKKRGMRVGKLVGELAEAHGEKGVNLSSFVRGFCMVEAERDLGRYRLVAGNFDLLDILHSAPSAGMLLNHDRIILESNAALRNWVGADAPILRQQKFDMVFEPRGVTRSLDETFELMRTGKLKRTQIQIAYGAATASATLTGLNVGAIFYCLVWLTPSSMRMTMR
jgi:predicted DNA-binding ribbon-helix-helix protein